MKITMRGANVYFSRPCTRGSSTSTPTKNISEFENWFALKKFRANFTIKSSESVRVRRVNQSQFSERHKEEEEEKNYRQ